MDWQRVQHFTFDRRHFVIADMRKESMVPVLFNDGRTIVLFDGKKRVFCSDFGHEDRLLQYDLRPGPAYSIVDGVLRRHQSGSDTISGYYPSYKHDQSGRQVWIGPKLRFYFEPQEEIGYLANGGHLLVTLRESKLCATCGGPFPIGSAPNAKYCSSECGLMTTDDRAKLAREKRHARMMAKKLKVMTAAPPRPCVTCKGPIDFHLCGPNAKYCCEECKPVKNTNVRDVTCYHCGKSFQSGRKGNRFFCSSRCRAGIGPRFPMPC